MLTVFQEKALCLILKISNVSCAPLQKSQPRRSKNFEAIYESANVFKIMDFNLDIFLQLVSRYLS